MEVGAEKSTDCNKSAEMEDKIYGRDTDNGNGSDTVRPADPADFPRENQQQIAVCALATGGAAADDTGFGTV